MAKQKHQCPACNSPNTTYRVSLNTYLCRHCQTTFYYGFNNRRFIEEYGTARIKRIAAATDVQSGSN